MNKEHIKSIILFMLVVCNLFLGSKILTKKLWPDGYNFFVSIRKTDLYNSFAKIFHGSSVYDGSKSHISVPEGIIVNTGYQTTRFPLKTSHENFGSIYSVCSDILKNALSMPQKSWSYTSADEWYSQLSGKSVYMSYSSRFTSSLFAEFAGCKNSEISTLIENIDNVVITSGVKPAVYLQYDDVYVKHELESSVNDLDEIINHFQQSFDETDANSAIINYSFELLFDKALENQYAVIGSMVPIYSTPIECSVINADNPIQKNNTAINANVVDRILALFEINANSVRRYTETGGTMVFVENNGTLKIHSNGLIEYNASDGAQGLNLTDSMNTYDNICAAADFMDSINASASATTDMTITSYVAPYGGVSGSADMYFDYSVDGIPVRLDSTELGHAVHIKIENGYLKEYRHLLRTYDITSDIQQVPIYIEELDKLISENPSETHTYIEKMYICYKDDIVQGQKLAGWQLEKGVK